MSPMFVRRIAGTLSAPLMVLVGACAQEPPQPVTIEDTREVSATVDAIDVQTRMMTLRGPEGETFTVEVDPAVKNLPQVKVGDRVVARYYEALGAELKKRGGTGEASASAEPETTIGVETAEPGARPAGVVSAETRTTVRISSIDKKNNVVSFYGADGMLRALPVHTPQGQEFIKKLKPGDEVEVTYTEAVAVSVEPAT